MLTALTDDARGLPVARLSMARARIVAAMTAHVEAQERAMTAARDEWVGPAAGDALAAEALARCEVSAARQAAATALLAGVTCPYCRGTGDVGRYGPHECTRCGGQGTL